MLIAFSQFVHRKNFANVFYLQLLLLAKLLSVELVAGLFVFAQSFTQKKSLFLLNFNKILFCVITKR